LWATFADKPALAGAFGMAVCALMLSGIYLSQKPEPVADSVVAEAWKLTAPVVNPAVGGVATPATMLAASSTNPVPASPVGGSLFDRLGVQGQTVPASFQPQGR
jgi:pyridoxal biosynthesis lyase PdxS